MNSKIIIIVCLALMAGVALATYECDKLEKTCRSECCGGMNE